LWVFLDIGFRPVLEMYVSVRPSDSEPLKLNCDTTHRQLRSQSAGCGTHPLKRAASSPAPSPSAAAVLKISLTGTSGAKKASNAAWWTEVPACNVKHDGCK
jgi:hypothetical protein